MGPLFYLLFLLIVLQCIDSFHTSLGVKSRWLTRCTNLDSRIKFAPSFAIAPSVRVDPVCPVFGICGGCQYQNLSYNHQLALKQEFVAASLKAFNLSTSRVRPVIPAAQELNYRNKAQFAIQRDEKGNINVGLYGLNSNTAVDTKKCFIQHKAVNSVLQQFRLFLQRHKPSIYNETTQEGSLRHLVVRVGFQTNEVMVCVVSATRTFGHQASFVQLMKQMPNVKSVLLHHNSLPGDQVIQDTRTMDAVAPAQSTLKLRVSPVVYSGKSAQNTQPKTVALSGRDYITDTIAGVKVKISLNSFVQSNPKQTAHLYEQVLHCVVNSTNSMQQDKTHAQAVPTTASNTIRLHSLTRDTTHSTSNSTRTVWDLYCGVGTIGMHLSKSPLVSKVVGVESSEGAVVDARHNARLNNISNIDFVCGLVENIILPPANVYPHTSGTAGDKSAAPVSELYSLPHIHYNDIVVLNPPRKGCHTSLLNTLLHSKARTIVYISCNPKTLARDLHTLTSSAVGNVGSVGTNNVGTNDVSTGRVNIGSGVYKIMSIQPIDMFPQTVHIETVVWLERK